MATYKAVTLDGQEHPPRDLWTLKQWYFARLIGPDSLLLSSDLTEWTRLKDLFDLPQWEAEERTNKGLGPTDSVFKVASTLEPPRLPEAMSQKPYKYDRDNERGLRAAGILLFMSALFNLGSLAFLLWRPSTLGPVSSFWGFAVLLDVIMGYKLMSSDNAPLWQKLTLVRVFLGAVLVGVLLMLIGPTPLVRLMGLMDLVFASSFFLLLLGQASRTRVVAGVLAFVVSVFGIAGVFALITIAGTGLKLEVYKHALPARSFFDSPSGGRIHLPDGWVLLRPDNPIVPRPYASMIAVHPDSGSFATLVIAQNRWETSLDTVLSTMVADNRQREPSLVEGDRLYSPFGRLDGRKVAMTWKEKGKEFKGWITVARNGSYLIFLSEWCAADTCASSEAQFAALEKGASASEPKPDSWGEFPRRK